MVVVLIILVLGICNPAGEGDNYNGLYFKQTELNEMVKSKSLHGLPVRTEHGSGDAGVIVSTFVRDDGALQCLLEVNGNTLHDRIAQGFVRDGVAVDLSMGYTVDVQQTDAERLRAGQKNTIEVSLVKKGAREGCHIIAMEEAGQARLARNDASKISEKGKAGYFSAFL